ncbi:restriction endonuclease subunit S [Mariniflexile sp.]|uniref:restriction endonuclease subunit S n=1 Tax=Mariniflexile sp. TaxID=1979402 RepID=UPI004048B9E2
MKNWKKVKLGTLLTESKIISDKPNPDNRIRVKLNVLGIEKRPITKEKKGATRYYIRKAGQFIYGKQNLHKGAFGIIPNELDGFESSSDIPAFDIDESCYPEWIFYFFFKNNFYLKLENLAKGVGSKRIQPTKIFNLEIYLPTKEEQRKLLDEIEKANNKNQELLNETKLQEENLNKLRVSIFYDAIKGKLTEEWRNQNTNIEPAKKLLKNIKKDRERLINENNLKKEKLLPSIKKEDYPFEIPFSWEWCRMQELCLNISSGSTPPKHEFKDSGIPFLKVYNIRNQKIDLNYKPQFISKEYHSSKLKRSVLRPGDVIMNIVGPPLGKTSIIPNDYEEWNCNQAIVFFKPVYKEINHWIYTFLLSEDYLKRIELIGTAGQDNISITKSKNIEIPLPPITEQTEIVKIVNQLISNCNNLEQKIIESKENSGKLMQSFLLELLGDEQNKILTKNSVNKITETHKREKKYNTKTINMGLIELLKVNGKLHAEDLWKMSEHYDDKNINDSIDNFYSDLKTKIEIDKSIKEVSNEKGYIELV